ncbi:MAG: hypothetical protein RML95_13435 [Anaerolineae bacterium]|nr:hypothetical protein [Anaerolineae bacterium]
MASPVDSRLLKDLLHLLLSDLRSPVADLLSYLLPMQAHVQAGEYAELTALSAFTLRYSERLLSVIDLLLDVIRDGVVKLATDRLSLHTVVENVRQAVSTRVAALRIVLHNHIPADLPRAVLDERLFTQALINLLEALFVVNSAAGNLHFWASYDGTSPRFQLRLHDERSSTDAAALSALFESPLSVLLSRHNSLRVILSRVIIRAHGADIQVVPAAENGVVLNVPLPLRAAEPSVKRLVAAPLFSDQPIETLGDTYA